MVTSTCEKLTSSAKIERLIIRLRQAGREMQEEMMGYLVLGASTILAVWLATDSALQFFMW
jgi:hypothetical protein